MLTNLNGGKYYVMRNTQNYGDALNMPSLANPLPELPAKQTQLLKMEGNENKVDLEWVIADFGENVGNDDDGPVVTPWKQLFYLKRVMEFRSILDNYQLEIFVDPKPGVPLYSSDGKPNPDAYNINPDNEPEATLKGQITNFKFQQSANEPITFRASTQFVVGDVISIVKDEDDEPLPGPDVT